MNSSQSEAAKSCPPFVYSMNLLGIVVLSALRRCKKSYISVLAMSVLDRPCRRVTWPSQSAKYSLAFSYQYLRAFFKRQALPSRRMELRPPLFQRSSLVIQGDFMALLQIRKALFAVGLSQAQNRPKRVVKIFWHFVGQFAAVLASNTPSVIGRRAGVAEMKQLTKKAPKPKPINLSLSSGPMTHPLPGCVSLKIILSTMALNQAGLKGLLASQIVWDCPGQLSSIILQLLVCSSNSLAVAINSMKESKMSLIRKILQQGRFGLLLACTMSLLITQKGTVVFSSQIRVSNMKALLETISGQPVRAVSLFRFIYGLPLMRLLGASTRGEVFMNQQRWGRYSDEKAVLSTFWGSLSLQYLLQKLTNSQRLERGTNQSLFNSCSEA